MLDANAKRVPVIAGVAATATADAIRQAREFEAMGIHGILTILETYFPVSGQGVIQCFTDIARSVTCPIVLYTNPSFQRSELMLQAIVRLARVPNICYISKMPQPIQGGCSRSPTLSATASRSSSPPHISRCA